MSVADDKKGFAVKDRQFADLESKNKQAKAIVWATRPKEQNKSWVHTLASEDFEVFDAPLLGIDAVKETKDKEKIKQQILHLDHYQAIIFVSQNAVNQALPWIESYWPQCPIGIDWYAVGSKTAYILSRKLEQVFGIAVDINAADSAMTSETLLDLPGLQNVDSSKICIMRGKGGRPKLDEVLTARGAQVDLCELYERTLPEQAIHQLDAFLSHYVYHSSVSGDTLDGSSQTIQNPLFISLFSGETLSNLALVLDSIKKNQNIKSSNLTTTTKSDVEKRVRCLKQNAVCCVPSERVADQAKALGFARVICSKNATEAAMLETINEYAATKI